MNATEATARETLDQFIARMCIKFTRRRIDRRPDMVQGDDTWDRGARHFKCVFTRRTGAPMLIKGRQTRGNVRSMIVYFSQGSAHTEGPTAADVLDCIASDVAGIVNARGFEDWAGDLGYDTDSRKAERTYKAIERQRTALYRLLGDNGEEIETLLFSMERL